MLRFPWLDRMGALLDLDAEARNELYCGFQHYDDWSYSEPMVDEEITIWLNRLRSGDSRAVEVIWQQYFEKLIRFARQRMSNMPRRVVDEEDVAISAMNSLYRGAAGERFPKLNDRHDLWKLLVTITARKTIHHQRRNMAEKRGGGKVRGESVFFRPDDDQVGLEQVLGSEPTPELAASVSEACAELLAKLDDEKLRTIAQLKLEGYTNDEIAEKLDCTTRTIERKLERIRSKWSRDVDLSG
ncbi:MAG: sigma-70 family RNA polymerase sigma factor [Planctomycetales bacterium]|nr:sigma-70 family RNA polymerase sigma factor [Planctomycetales bacterium]